MVGVASSAERSIGRASGVVLLGFGDARTSGLYLAQMIAATRRIVCGRYKLEREDARKKSPRLLFAHSRKPFASANLSAIVQRYLR
jgi:hypothetical protein